MGRHFFIVGSCSKTRGQLETQFLLCALYSTWITGLKCRKNTYHHSIRLYKKNITVKRNTINKQKRDRPFSHEGHHPLTSEYWDNVMLQLVQTWLIWQIVSDLSLIGRVATEKGIGQYKSGGNLIGKTTYTVWCLLANVRIQPHSC